MSISEINQYDTVELLEDINPNIKRGMKGVVLEKYSDEDYEIEFLDKGKNIEYKNQFTFTVNRKLLKKQL